MAMPLRNKIQSLLPTYAIDSATFIGSGILAHSYSTIWINDPTTKSGVVLAGFFNATALGIANYFGKTDKNTSSDFKIILTVGTLAITTFALPYLAIALKDRFAIVLTKQVALQIGGLNLAAKASTYMLYVFGSRLTSLKHLTTEAEINSLSPEKLKQYYEFFKNHRAPKSVEGTLFNPNPHNHYPLNNYWHCHNNEIRLAYLNAFFKNDLPFFAFDSETIKKMDFSKNPTDIDNFTKNQALWLHKILSSSDTIPLSQEISKPLALLFYKHDLPPLDQTSGKKDKIIDFTLPKPNAPDEIMGLTPNQLRWHKLHTSNLDIWKSFSLELQFAYNQKWLEQKINTWFYCPTSVESIQKADKAIIVKLCKDFQFRNAPNYYSLDMANALDQRRTEIFKSIVQNVKSVQEVEKLSDEAVKDCHNAFSILLCGAVPPNDMQIALSKRFIDCNLPPPHFYWRCECEVPTTPKGFITMEYLQLSWLRSHLSTENGLWESLTFSCQASYNNRWLEIDESVRPITSIPTVTEITSDHIGVALTNVLWELYSTDRNSPWDEFDYEIQQAFNAHFKKHGKEELLP